MGCFFMRLPSQKVCKNLITCKMYDNCDSYLASATPILYPLY